MSLAEIGRLGDSHPDTVESKMGLASIHTALGKHEEAEPLLQEVLEWREKKLGPLHPDTLVCLNRLAETSLALGHLRQARQELRKHPAKKDGSTIAPPDPMAQPLPPEPSRSRGAELLSQGRIPPWAEACNGQKAILQLEVLLGARKARKSEAAQASKRRWQREKYERWVEEWERAPEAPAERFWRRHGFGRSTRREVPSERHQVEPWDELAAAERPQVLETQRRAFAHAQDGVKAVLDGGASPLVARRMARPREVAPLEPAYDWKDPYTMAYNCASARQHRQMKWQQRKDPNALQKVEATFGFDEEEVAMMKATQAMDPAGGFGTALEALHFAERRSWRQVLRLAPRAKATAFEMPKELALQVALAFSDAAEAAAEAEEDKAKEEGLAAAMALLSSVAARARDAESAELPLQGLEALALTGLGWAAFSNMFFAALHTQQQLLSARQGARIQMDGPSARRVGEVFLCAEASVGRKRLVELLAPAGRRLAAAAAEGLEARDVAQLALLEELAVRLN
ncbi:unnamed protein product [Effrenium voratum]|nr:unnamed protein product [Effrenium voratum]